MATKVLVIEDDPVFKTIITRLLLSIDESIEIQSVTAAHEAVATLSRADFDLIVADIYLKGHLTGFDVWEICRAKSPFTPFVFMTSMPVDKFRSIAEKGGLYPPLMSKPPAIDKWREILETALGKRPAKTLEAA